MYFHAFGVLSPEGCMEISPRWSVLCDTRDQSLSTHSREDTAAFVAESFPEWIDQAIYEAEQLCEHRINLLGYPDLRLGRDINWHRDPVTGYVWPAEYWANYDLVHSSRVDPKCI